MFVYRQLAAPFGLQTKMVSNAKFLSSVTCGVTPQNGVRRIFLTGFKRQHHAVVVAGLRIRNFIVRTRTPVVGR